MFSLLAPLSLSLCVYAYARILGYHQNQQMDQIALEFAKQSPYLQEEYSFLKCGLKIKPLDKPRTLLKVIKEFIEIEEIGMFAFIENNWL